MYTKGEKFKPSARLFNEVEKVARDRRSGMLSQVGPGVVDESLQTMFVVARNDTGVDLPLGSPLSVACATVSAANEAARAFERNLVWVGNRYFWAPPTQTNANAHQLIWRTTINGVTLEPIKSTKHGRVAIAGMAWARVDGSASGRLGPLVNTHADHRTKFRSYPLGPHAVITGTTNGCFAMLNYNQPQFWVGKAVTSVPSNTTGECFVGVSTDGPRFRAVNRTGRATTSGNLLYFAVGHDSSIEIIQEVCPVAT